jgi:benzoyl-CoA reductase/2-hydroxyglutaryl-CoA dehydratase subunit BcrC/BadD/HgdB
MFESWSVAPGQFGHYLRVPHLATPESVDVFTEDLELLLEALAAYVGRSITARDLRAAIALRRQAREALDRLLALRLDDPPRITGSEALAALLLEGTLPPAVLCELLQEATAEALQRRPSGPRLRLLLGGGVTDELQLVRELETLGGVVVADNLCHGSRILRGVPDEEQEPLRWLARSYLEELRCPRMFDAYPERLRWLRATAREARVDGAILVHNKFCDLHGVENARLRIDLEQEGVPVLVLEKEYGAVADLGRIRTRVQAFLERVSS